MDEGKVVTYVVGFVIAGIVGLSLSITECTRVERESFNRCVEKTNQPLECEAAKRIAR